MKKIPLLFALMMFISPSTSWAMWYDFEEDLPSSRGIAPQLSPQPDDELPQAILQGLTLIKNDLISFGKAPLRSLVNGFCRSFFENQELTMFLTGSAVLTLGDAGSCWCYSDRTTKWSPQYYMNTTMNPGEIDKCSRACGIPNDSEGSWLTKLSNGQPCPISTRTGASACWCFNENNQQWVPKYSYSGPINPTVINKCSLACSSPLPYNSEGSFLTRLTNTYGQPCL